MNEAFLTQFRRRLHDWLQLRLAGDRLPFRRVEETPRLANDDQLPPPDLVLWINRDSLLAGGMILIPPRIEPAVLERGRLLAASLGLCQFVTWGPHGVDIWESGAGGHRQLQSWAVTASAETFTAVFEQLLLSLRQRAVAAMLPAEQLPPGYFVNLCRLVLNDIAPVLQESARVAAPTGQTDAQTLRRARDKGWLSLWRLLTLLWHERLPPGIDPERLERAFGYALTGLEPLISRQQLPDSDEPPLPEAAAIRLHHLAGRLAQLGWQQDAQRARTSLEQLLVATASDCRVATTAITPPPGDGVLLVNHLPPQWPETALLLAPRPCLAALALTARATGKAPPAWMAEQVTALPATCRPDRIIASLPDVHPLTAPQRRAHLVALRHPWPYRRFSFAAVPAWLWEALFLGGIVPVEGELQLTLPPDWLKAPDVDQLWQALAERLALAEWRCHVDGRQTLLLVGRHRAPDQLLLHRPDGTCRPVPPLPGHADAAFLAELVGPEAPALPLPSRNRRVKPRLAETIAAKVFRDGLPNFPADYLRRFEVASWRTYRLPGPLRADTHFFGKVRLQGPDGELVEADNPADAEALQLAARDGRAQVNLPVEPDLTTSAIVAYRNDLQKLWQALVDECRRHRATQHQALTLARRLWREQGLPPR